MSDNTETGLELDPAYAETLFHAINEKLVVSSCEKIQEAEQLIRTCMEEHVKGNFADQLSSMITNSLNPIVINELFYFDVFNMCEYLIYAADTICELDLRLSQDLNVTKQK
ncbi:hypothetical protein [Anaeromicropila populeti]|uniref:Uncharacterized protein n=1 Tax=Anaeromicropila populeti TaxID=37658 RepID=A0A1I6JP57_9FIRM|nr:hypothetical protein [Anaeromicropila populeti]SFR80701.1 hypothetical protein SAMN05661086_01823 [Anaeromicropila populeti]